MKNEKSEAASLHEGLKEFVVTKGAGDLWVQSRIKTG